LKTAKLLLERGEECQKISSTPLSGGEEVKNIAVIEPLKTHFGLTAVLRTSLVVALSVESVDLEPVGIWCTRTAQ
jgi:hypothetical protein